MRSVREWWKVRSSRQRIWLIVGAVIVLLAVIGAAGGGKHKASAPTASTPQQAVKTPAAPAPKKKPAKPAGAAKAVKYVDDLEVDAGRVQVYVQAALVSIDAAVKSSSQAKLYTAAQDAQTAHDRLDSIRNDFARAQDGGQLGDAELEIFASANDLKNAMGALTAYTGNPTPATFAHFTAQFEPAKEQWNHAVRTIWSLAHRHPAPAI